jgi:DNA-binding response OmpR family regulator
MGQVVSPQFAGRPSRTEHAGTVARVLVVDSEPATLAAISQALQSEGHATDVEATGGVELADALRRREPSMQVLYVTSRRDGRVPALFDHDEVIERPFSESELVDAVSSLLYWRRPRGTR